MCGIAGFLEPSDGRSPGELELRARRMGGRLVHRGPDSGGVWVDPAQGVGLAHRRLAILDLSPEGAQPMGSGTGRFVVTFNGEIYNFGELRAELEQAGHRFRGRSDTEVLLAAVERWGVAPALERFNGMYAFALWDRAERVLHLARDRMGEKPLYYGWFGATFLFGSELKALLAHPACGRDVDRNALALFVRHGYVPAPYTIYAGLRKLEPAGLLSVSSRRPGAQPVVRYWSHERAAARAVADPFRGTAAEAVDELHSLLSDSVKLRMQSDVPLGAFLSGGVDSSTVVALMQAQSTAPVRTFTIGFREASHDEAVHARAVARHLGTDHRELYVTPREALEVIPRLPSLYDEPFADSSQIPTFLVAQLTRRHVTVSLSGDGGDELFCGYTRYALDRFWGALRCVPAPLRSRLGRALRALPEPLWEGLVRSVAPLLPGGLATSLRVDRLQAAAEILALPTGQAMYRRLVSGWKEPSLLVPGAVEPPTVLTRPITSPALPTFADQMMYLDALTYLPDDILAKVDRATMGVSLEARVPLLDHRLVELAWRLPLALKRRGGRAKWILRQVLYRYVPPALIERPKKGFAVPVGSWLRGPLRDWACDLLAEDRLRREGFLDPGLVRAALHRHLAGERDLQYYLWTILMFEAWLASDRGGAGAGADVAPALPEASCVA